MLYNYTPFMFLNDFTNTIAYKDYTNLEQYLSSNHRIVEEDTWALIEDIRNPDFAPTLYAADYEYNLPKLNALVVNGLFAIRFDSPNGFPYTFSFDRSKFGETLSIELYYQTIVTMNENEGVHIFPIFTLKKTAFSYCVVYFLLHNTKESKSSSM